MKKTFHIIILGLFIAQSLVLYVVEGMLPVPFIAPGAKLGLANLITVIALYALPRKRGINAFLYSVAGAAFSLGAMMVLQKTGKFSIIGVSTAGGIFHNLGQVIVASLVVENIKIMLYLPILAVAGTGTGILIGITAIFTLRHLKRLPIYRRMQEENQAIN